MKEREIKKIVFLWSTGSEGMQMVHLDKDTFWVSYTLGKKLNSEVEIVYYLPEGAKALPSVYCGVKLTALCGQNLDELAKEYVKQNAKEIDLLVMFHLMRKNFRLANIYKKHNKNGYCYIKLDANNLYKPSIKDFFKRFVGGYLVRNVDLFSVESKELYEQSHETGICGFRIGKKTVCMPNGFSDIALNFPKRSFEDKENLIIAVGRIGSVPKNNEKLLDAISSIDLKNWKVAFVGPFTEEFKIKYDAAMNQNPGLKGKVELTGSIEDKHQLFSYYDRAKIFAFTSDWESFGLVLTEALCFGNYIITTDVGAAACVTDNFRLGEKIVSKEDLARSLQRCIDGNTVLDHNTYQQALAYAENFRWDSLVQSVVDKILERITA